MADFFSYMNINRCEGGRLILRHGYYQAFESALYSDHYIFLKNLVTEHVVPALKNHERGYKLYVVLDDSQQDENLEKGWVIVRDILMKYNVYFFKVIKNQSRKFLTEPEVSGHVVIIYAFREKRSDWATIIGEITRALTQQKIRPGQIADKDKRISNSKYVSYYNDAVSLLPDPFADLKL